MRAVPEFTLQRWTRWVLAAWLCVALGSVVSPMARAHSGAVPMEALCSMAGGMPGGAGVDSSNRQQVPSPAALLLALDDAADLHHGLDCPLCLPLLAPPPLHTSMAALPLGVETRTQSLWAAPWVYRVAAALPARGPPVLTLNS